MAWTVGRRPDPSAEEPPSLRIVEALAAARGDDSTEIEPLYGHFDLEAIDELVENSRGEFRIELSVDGHRVVVGADGSVEIS